MPPPTAMKSLWQACVVTCAALNRAASVVVDDDLAAIDAACGVAPVRSGEGLGLLGELRLQARLNRVCSIVEHRAMLMVLSPHPAATEEAPPGPASQILPTPGHSPFVALDASTRLDAVAAPVADDDSETNTAARIIVAVTSGGAARLRPMRPRGKPFISTPEHPVIGTLNQQFGSSVGLLACKLRVILGTDPTGTGATDDHPPEHIDERRGRPSERLGKSNT